MGAKRLSEKEWCIPVSENGTAPGHGGVGMKNDHLVTRYKSKTDGDGKPFSGFSIDHK
jgi:hypothetical protein